MIQPSLHHDAAAFLTRDRSEPAHIEKRRDWNMTDVHDGKEPWSL